MVTDKLRSALDKLPLGVAVATLGRGGVESGLTISWMTPVSFDPAQILIAVDKLHYSVEFLRSTKSFVLNLLKADQTKLASHFAKRSMSGEDKLKDVETKESSTGAAILAQALAYFDCEVVNTVEAGDHILFIGRIVDAGILNEDEPLTTLSGMRYRKSEIAKH